MYSCSTFHSYSSRHPSHKYLLLTLDVAPFTGPNENVRVSAFRAVKNGLLSCGNDLRIQMHSGLLKHLLAVARLDSLIDLQVHPFEKRHEDETETFR